MSHLASAALAALFVLFGLISAYYLVRGLRQGRFSRRLRPGRLAYYPGSAPPDSDLDYNYRGRDPIGFWLSALVQVAAIVASSIALYVLVSLP